MGFHAASSLVELERAITLTTWEVLAGVVSSPSFFSASLERCCGRITGQFKADGGIAELRIVEDDGQGGEVVLNTSAFTIPDTSDAWQAITFETNTQMGSGQRTYRLEGRLVDAASSSIRFVSLSLLEALG